MDEFEWDEAKRQRNIQLRHMDFIDAAMIFDGRPVLTYLSVRGEETRYATTGMLRGKLWVVVWTERQGRKRIISAYRADDAERRKYQQIFPVSVATHATTGADTNGLASD